MNILHIIVDTLLKFLHLLLSLPEHLMVFIYETSDV